LKNSSKLDEKNSQQNIGFIAESIYSSQSLE